MSAEKDFWRMVENDTPPCPDGLEATGDALQVIYSDAQDRSIDLFGRETILNEYLQLKNQKKSLDERIREIENIVKSDMKQAERAVCGAYAVTWKPQVRQTFQIKPFSKDHPDIDLSPYYKESVSRLFKVTERELNIKEAV